MKSRVQSGFDVPRVLGVRDAGRPGPLVLIVAGQHGNETGGIEGASEVLAGLDASQVRGRVVALSGNRGALRRGMRHTGADLNRLWTDEEIGALATRTPADDSPDHAELRELHAALREEIERRPPKERGPRSSVVLIDLHSTTADGGGFTIAADSRASLSLARAIGLPVVLGLEGRLDGPLVNRFVRSGFTALVVEGGQHDDERTAGTCAAAVWLALAHCRAVAREHPRVAEARERLALARAGVPKWLELTYVHRVPAGEPFVMEPGWRNFMRVRRDQSLALQNGVVVQAPRDGFMLMPLYERSEPRTTEGGVPARTAATEGFFLCRAVSEPWVTLSRLARVVGRALRRAFGA